MYSAAGRCTCVQYSQRSKHVLLVYLACPHCLDHQVAVAKVNDKGAASVCCSAIDNQVTGERNSRGEGSICTCTATSGVVYLIVVRVIVARAASVHKT